MAFMGRDPFAGLTGIQSDFYNDGESGSRSAYDRYLDSLGLTQNARRYARGLWGQVQGDFQGKALGAADPSRSFFTDYLKGGGAQGFIDQYNTLSASARGFNVGRFRPGRVMF